MSEENEHTEVMELLEENRITAKEDNGTIRIEKQSLRNDSHKLEMFRIMRQKQYSEMTHRETRSYYNFR